MKNQKIIMPALIALAVMAIVGITYFASSGSFGSLFKGSLTDSYFKVSLDTSKSRDTVKVSRIKDSAITKSSEPIAPTGTDAAPTDIDLGTNISTSGPIDLEAGTNTSTSGNIDLSTAVVTINAPASGQNIAIGQTFRIWGTVTNSACATVYDTEGPASTQPAGCTITWKMDGAAITPYNYSFIYGQEGQHTLTFEVKQGDTLVGSASVQLNVLPRG